MMITGIGVTLTVTLAVLLHPNVVPVTMYEVVFIGEAVELAPVVELRPVAGLQT
jgi:hypothetical protein